MGQRSRDLRALSVADRRCRPGSGHRRARLRFEPRLRRGRHRERQGRRDAATVTAPTCKVILKCDGGSERRHIATVSSPAAAMAFPNARRPGTYTGGHEPFRAWYCSTWIGGDPGVEVTHDAADAAEPSLVLPGGGSQLRRSAGEVHTHLRHLRPVGDVPAAHAGHGRHRRRRRDRAIHRVSDRLLPLRQSLCAACCAGERPGVPVCRIQLATHEWRGSDASRR